MVCGDAPPDHYRGMCMLTQVRKRDFGSPTSELIRPIVYSPSGSCMVRLFKAVYFLCTPDGMQVLWRIRLPC